MGLKQNDKEANRWHKRALKHGFYEANETTAEDVNEVRGLIEKNPGESKVFVEAKELENQDLDLSLGVKYYKGIEVEQDYDKAAKELEREVAKGSIQSAHYLAESYRYGYGVEANFPEAICLYTQAAMNGFANSQCALGSLYARGEGVNQNYVEALKWYHMASEQGHEEAKNREIALEKEYAAKQNSVSEIDKLLEGLNGLIGLKEVKASVREIVNLLQVNEQRKESGLPITPMSHHLVFTGNPGTGKTTVARILASIYRELGVLEKGHLVEVDRSQLVAGYIGQTAIKTQEMILEALDGVLFIDEAYSLAHGHEEWDFGREAIDTLVKAMEDYREQFIVIAAGYEEPMINFINMNPGLRSRFNKYIKFPDDTSNELTRIYMQLCKNNQYRVDAEVKKVISDYFTSILSKKPENFGNGREARNLFEKTVVNVANRVAGLGDVSLEALVTVTREDIPIVK